MLDIKSFYEADSGTWTHLLADPDSKTAAIIDPVWVYDPVSGMADTAFIDDVLAAAEHAQCRVEWVLETHAHADHLTAADYGKVLATHTPEGDTVAAVVDGRVPARSDDQPPPPLTVTRDEIDWALERVAKVLTTL